MKLLLAPLLILIATLLSRRWGNSFGGWLIALPLTSAPAAFLMAHEQGFQFARTAALGMLLATISQAMFVLAYAKASNTRGALFSFISGTIAFSLSTLILSQLHISPLVSFIFVIMVITFSLRIQKDKRSNETRSKSISLKWDLALRMIIAILVVFLITESAPIVGAHIAGLLSPYPILAAILAVFSHLGQGPVAARASLRGLLVGLFTPTIFFFIVVILITHIGFHSFIYAVIAALVFQYFSGRYLLDRTGRDAAA